MGCRLLICAICCATAGVGAQAPGDLPELIRRLDAPDARERTKATDTILRNETITLRQIEESLRSTNLSLEQRQRLLGLGFSRFQTEPRAAMGIKPDGNLGTHGVVLASVEPGFPSFKVLRAGDRIIGAGGTTIDTWETIRAVIISHDPGDEIPVTVVREGATLNLKLTLGSFGDFRQPQMLEPRIMIEGWRRRTKGLRGPDPAPAVESGVPFTAWANAYGAVADEPLELPIVAGRADGDDGRVGVMAGGEPRGGMAPPDVILTRATNGNRQFSPPADALQAMQMQIENARRFQDVLTQRIAANRTLLADPKLTAAERRSLEDENKRLADQVQGQNDSIRSLRWRINQMRVR